MSDDTHTRMIDHPLIQGQWKEPKIGDRTDKGVVTCIDEEARDRSESWIYIVKRSGARCRYYHRRELIWHPIQEDLQGMLNWHWDLKHRGDAVHLILGDCPDGTEFTGATAKEALAQGVMHQHGLRWDDSEGWVER